jgi:hypothetical protein
MAAVSQDSQANEEAPAPAQPRGVDDDAAEQWTADGGDGHHRAEVTVVTHAFPRRDHGGDHDLDQGLQAADTQTSEATATMSWPAFWARPGQERADDEDHDGELHQDLLVEQVGELAPDRRGRRRGQQRGRGRPTCTALGSR